MTNFGRIFDAPETPSIEEAIAAVRQRAAANDTEIPAGAQPKITQHPPSETNPYGSLHVIFDWDGEATT